MEFRGKEKEEVHVWPVTVSWQRTNIEKDKGKEGKAQIFTDEKRKYEAERSEKICDRECERS